MPTRLKRLTLHRYENVAPCDLQLDDRINILLGANGTGKTTLLELISWVLRSSFVNDPRDVELDADIDGDDEHVHLRVEPDASEGKPSASVSPPGYEATSAEGARSGSLVDQRQLRWNATVRDNSGLSASLVATRGSTVLTHPVHGEMLLRPGWPALEGALFALGRRRVSFLGNCVRFDESLGGFRELLTKEVVFGVTFVDVAHEGRDSIWQISGAPIPFPFGGSLKGHIDAPSFLALPLAPSVGDKFSPLTGFESIEFNLQAVEIGARKTTRPAGGDAGVARYKVSGAVARRNGKAHDIERMSYGQKRLLAFLCHVMANPSIVIADELVNGMHHHWIDACLKELEGRQSFLTSQNPLLLDYLEFDSLEQVQSAFILCDTDEEGRFRFRNMNESEAARFLRAYEGGIQHVGEILRVGGFW